MLDADSRRVRGRLRHIAATALAILALASFGGCGGGAGNPSSSSSGGSWLSGTTKWFGGSKTIAVAPIVGAPPSVAKDLSQALVTAGKDRNLTIVPSGSGEANYAMRGYLLANNESGGTKVSYVWDVSDAKGARVVRISGEEMIKGICEKFRKSHTDHIAVYGSDNNQRLTGLHETQSIDRFSYGVSDRGSSIRIPVGTAQNGWKGYLEDRRPASNADPYKVTARILSTLRA